MHKVSFVVGVLLLCLAAACGPRSASRGVAVNILRPVKMEQGSCDKVGLLWLDSSRVIAGPDVDLSAAERRMIADEARQVCAETNYIVTTTVEPALDGSEYHLMTVKVNELDIVFTDDGETARKAVKAALAATLKQGGVRECYTAPPVVREYVRQVPSYQAAQLPSDFELKAQAARKALGEIVATFVPARVRTFREVRGVTGDMAKVGDLIDGGMCRQALLLCQDYLQTDPEDVTALYNAGLAAECMAGATPRQARKLKALNLALGYYRKAALEDSGDKEIRRAVREVALGVELYADALERQGIAKEKARGFDTSTGF